ncbi:MAG: hypothetical protein FD162_3578 [Rhodobacteraceae bacterium]|uniref:AzlD domain-containing protein n=1 Tax=Cypionkella sp. TaxID=2811411 RepID=UPI001326A958|nr:AzlD domain-containing protein [Cypionkella sp.]KAF0170312.1 MAG: hypothetical protein FD162_3578 [Paracoccaceae bacterium]MDO8327987.1 AzlD domain-containing protein [Cypionkella sp.]
MRAELLTLALIVGAFTWAFRFFPTKLDVSAMKADGVLARFLASTGPAAIATLFVASVLPMLQQGLPVPLITGTAAVLATYLASRSVVGATLAGSAGYGLAVWALA